ncbi:aminotransferase class V-fold PLP-dependent enzyme [Oscillatoria amoena NRMC-F 0135]|nr:aminotransferase class V-fold PLP-dependent enzyme [Oscillatoria amoena NRMC-F 0135]
MAENRRNFVKNMTVMGLLAPASSFEWMNYTHQTGPTFDELESIKAANEDEFWKAIQQCFAQSEEFINLENGYFSPTPLPVLNAFVENNRMVNANSSFYMRRRKDDDRERVRKELAEFAGVNADEVALMRSTTDGLNVLIHGLPLKAGDEVVLSNQDYDSMVEAFKQRAQREGIVLKTIDLPLQPANDEEVVNVYEKAITPKTRLLLVTHMIHLTGHLLPVKKVCEMAHAKGVEVMVDGAHAFAHIDFRIPDLDCDYYAASLHKWLCNPLGAGILWVKKEHIEKVWPLFGETSRPKTDIRKFERFGTQNTAIQLSLSAAIKFHTIIGSNRKMARLRWLKNYWVEQLSKVDGVSFNTPIQNERTGAIANFALMGYTPTQLAAALYDSYKIFTVGIETPAVNGVRVTPHLYTTQQHLDALISAVKELAKK